jgi:hypothetical protein
MAAQGSFAGMTAWHHRTSVLSAVHSVALLVMSSLMMDCRPAGAETAISEAAQAMVGSWEISNVERDRRCPLTFSVEPTAGGFRIGFDPACATAFPQLGAVVAWGFGRNDVLRLLDGGGGAVMEFTEVESGMYESERGPDGLLFLQTQAVVTVETRTPEQLAGDWTVMREADKPLCRLTLSDTPADSPGSFRMFVKGSCDKSIVAFGLTSWRLDGSQLVLSGRGGSWRFAESDATIWERVPLSVDPLLLVRQ